LAEGDIGYADGMSPAPIGARPIATRRGPPIVAVLLLSVAAVCSGEPLVCRGFDAASAANAITSATGRLHTVDPQLQNQRVWFILTGPGPDEARQALAHALSCWWSGGSFSRNRQLPDQTMSVHAFPPLPAIQPGAESLMRRLMEPWLAGDGGLVLDLQSRVWTVTASSSGQQHCEQLLTAMGDPHPRAPNLLPAARLPEIAISRPPAGSTLGDWAIDLGRVAGISVALGPDLDPAAASPARTPMRLVDVMSACAAQGIQSGFHHGVLCLSAGAILDRQHPAERAAIAILPVGHLTRDADRLATLAAQLGARVAPQDWDLPGWTITPLPARAALLVVGSPEAIHAVMTALEAADQAGLDAWLH
jgi:hypothetical protein